MVWNESLRDLIAVYGNLRRLQTLTSGCVSPLRGCRGEVQNAKKMGKCKFNDKWMEEDAFRRWLAPAENNNEAMCKLCKKTFSLGTMGLKAVESHMKGGKHQRYVAAASHSGARLIPALFAARPNDVTSSDATSQSAITSFISPPDTQKAEVLWVLHTVTRHN